MRQLLEVLVFSLLPASGILIGSLLAECMRTPKWLIGASLHATAGVAIALVSLELMPRILDVTPLGLIVLAFVAGAFCYVLIAYAWGGSSHRPGKGQTGAWMVYLAIATDLTSDGLMIGAGSAVGSQVGFLLAATQSIANLPGGFAATSNFRDDGMPWRRRFLLSLALVIPALLSAGAAFLVLRGGSPLVQNMVLTFFVGLLLLATIEDVIPQGDEPEPPRWISTLAFTLGFSGLAILTAVIN